MKSSTITLSVLLVAAVAYAAYLQTELNRLKALSEEAPLQQFAKAELPEGDVATEEPEIESEMAVETVPEEGRRARGGDRQNRRAEQMKQMLSVFEDPDMRMDMVERAMNRVDSRYADFFKTLNLSPDQLDTLRTLMAEEGVVNSEMRMRGFGGASEEERAEAEAARAYQNELIRDQIALVLGEEGSDALKEYSETLPYRGEVEALASSLSFSNTPLTDGQSDALAGALRDVSNSFEYTVDLSNMRGRDLSDIDSNDVASYFDERAMRDQLVLEAAADNLNDEQLAAYAERQLAERERDLRQLEFMQENPDLGGGRGGPGGGGRGGPGGGGGGGRRR